MGYSHFPAWKIQHLKSVLNSVASAPLLGPAPVPEWLFWWQLIKLEKKLSKRGHMNSYMDFVR